MTGYRPAWWRRVVVVLSAGAALTTLAGGCVSGRGDAAWRSGGGTPGGPAVSVPPPSTPVSAGPSGVDGNPLSGSTFYVEPGSLAARQVTLWQSQGRADDARQLSKISARPLPKWLTSTSAATSSDVNSLVRRAAAVRQLPVLVAYAIPHRDCGSFSAGGAASPAEYRAWMRAIAAGIGSQPAVVILEPDAVAHSVTGCADTSIAERYALLADAVVTLKATGSVRVYLDAGNPAWMRDHLKALANALRQSGVARSDGFALNVANFVTTAENASFGLRLSDALGGTHFVIDTSRNGNGPWPDGAQANGGPAWCNPPGRMLGRAPTSQTGLARVDALLWVKRPGESDGPCRPGEPGAGAWWPEYALDLARRSP
jgi:endoglucanase